MTVSPFPKVRDLTGGSRSLSVESDGSSFFDMLLTIWSAFDATDDQAVLELGEDWFAEIVEATSPELRNELETLGGEGCHGWLALLGLVAAAPHPHDIDSALKWLSGVDPARLRRALLDYKCAASGADSETLDRAVEGDEEALADLFSAKPSLLPHFQELLGLEPGALRERIVSALTRFRSEVYLKFEDEFGQSTARAASARRALAREVNPEEIIEDVTNGLDYRIPPGVSHLVLVPSVVLRPWALIDRHGDLLIVVYPVADEFIDADPDAPPSWVVKLHKALGDERRLRILRRLSQDDGATLEDLAELLDLSKSTVHHHVGLLRAAGLVRVRVDAEGSSKSVYTLRPAALGEGRVTLDDYLRTETSNLAEVRSER